MLPLVAPSRRARSLLDSAPFYVSATEFNATVAALDALAGLPMKWAACTVELQAANAPLPCSTSGATATGTCVDGLRVCSTLEENTRGPSLELDFHDYEVPTNGRAYLYEVNFHLPALHERGELFFGNQSSGRGWTLTVYDGDRNELSTQCQDWSDTPIVAYYTGLHSVRHPCLGSSATESDYEVLAQARYLRLTLVGDYRQIWLESVDVYFKDMIERVPAPPQAPIGGAGTTAKGQTVNSNDGIVNMLGLLIGFGVFFCCIFYHFAQSRHSTLSHLYL